MSRDTMLRDGMRILDPVMGRAGFRRDLVHEGHYLCVQYARRRRVLELHFAGSLRLVSQRIDDLTVMHDDFMRALLGPAGGHYPADSSDPLDGFHALRMDLEHYCADFLSGKGRAWREIAERALRDPRRFTITHEFLQMEDARRDARSAFGTGDFRKVVAIYSSMESDLMPAECRRLEIARERVRTGKRDGW